MTTQQIMDAIEAVMRDGRPMQEIMRDAERKSGFRVVVPGEVLWLSADDWDATVTVSVDDKHKTVRLVAILAKSPGKGAFRRTVRAIMDAGLTPCVVEPTHEMRATMQRWRWAPRRVGRGFDSEEQWRPRKGFKII